MDFQECSVHIKSSHDHFSDEQKLHLYGLYKQATQGDCNEIETLFDPVRNAKISAWKIMRGISSSDARRMYVEYYLTTDSLRRKRDSEV
jgi:diazepam-binding inhibitor (GABA receptor modulator, acyl-CoA-binding protein)